MNVRLMWPVLSCLMVTVLFLGSCTPVEQSTPTPTPTPIGIKDAIDRGLIAAHFRGTGSSSGDSIEATFDVEVDMDVEIVVPRGTVLIPRGTAQSMVLMALRGIITGPATFRPVLSITLRPGTRTSKTYLFEAYCLDFHRDNPASSTSFSLGGSASETVQAILTCGHEADVGAIQAAIWAVTDNVSKTELQSRFPVTSSELESAREMLECAGVEVNTLRLF